MTQRADESTASTTARILDSLDYRAVFEAVPDGIAIVDAHGVIQDVNERFEALFGYTREDLVGRSVDTLVPESARRGHQNHRSRYAADPYSRPMGVGLDLEACHRDGHRFPVEISLSPLATPGGHFIVCSVRDVSERQRLRRFSASTLRAAEDERLRVAQELHDDTAQRLSALLLRLRVARSAEDRSDLDERLGELREAIQECADGVRRIARGLRPPELLDVGVIAAIRAHVGTVEETGDLSIEIHSHPVEDVLADDAKLVLYRVVQEALSNVLRHARARSVRLSVRRSGEHVIAEIHDDGVGFEREPSGPSRGLGLVGMEERVASVGGMVEVESLPGQGTLVRVEIPIEPEIAPNA